MRKHCRTVTGGGDGIGGGFIRRQWKFSQCINVVHTVLLPTNRNRKKKEKGVNIY